MHISDTDGGREGKGRREKKRGERKKEKRRGSLSFDNILKIEIKTKLLTELPTELPIFFVHPFFFHLHYLLEIKASTFLNAAIVRIQFFACSVPVV